ncbi:uncharacterized protein LOC106168394 [Lingula anatina]|uniref:Uncharacterized protein LOC106168394 n=1 Tax=Lingula anatina TaxID=7574 RepID=A0A1S3IXX6_LINAN|nr:uncharacterized protein LOC106168394 [Lingula anatina]XP_013402884.1 uncharacterized protein LOC106168394 [Lingula anatina]|eukprot:XP_013402883.1 uncharacterized protein LOC106168394 [Lingula anatina]
MSESGLKAKFLEFCAEGRDKVDSAKLSKIFRDCKLLNKKLTATDVDILFNRTANGARYIDYQQFEDLLDNERVKEAHPNVDIKAKIAESDGPRTFEKSGRGGN